MKGTQLFAGSDLSAILENQKQKIEKMVLGISSHRILTIDPEKLVSELTKKLHFEPVVLLEDNTSVEQKETKIDANQHSLIFGMAQGKSSFVSGTKVTYYVPFEGNVELLKAKPNYYSYNSSQAAKIVKNELVFEYNITDGNVLRTKRDFDRAFGELKQMVRYINDQIEQYNQSLDRPIRSKISARQQILISSRQQINELGFKIRQKDTVVSKAKAQPAKTSKPKSVSTTRRVVKTPVEESLDYDVALSFAGENRPYVEKVARLLKAKNIKVFYDNFNKVELWGNNLIDHLGEVYAQRSRFIVMFISKHYAEKEWTNHERKFAQEREFKLKKNCILPARFDDTDIPGIPSTLGYIDLQKTTP